MNSQIILTLIFFCLIVLALAVYTKSTGGLFLARKPMHPADYEHSEENETERRVGLRFVKYAYLISAIALPILLLLYPSRITKFLAILLVIGISIRLDTADEERA